jgi:SAM-dependent methyltransferase
MKQAQDRFSNHAGAYAQFRPVYPEVLYDFVLSHVKGRELAWDCGTGNGQVAVRLAEHFKQVIATDLSEKQLSHAVQKENIQYKVSRAEQSGLADNSVDLITVAQALHWFDTDAFFREVHRVAKQGALLACWGYGLLTIEPAIDELIGEFYKNTIGPYWEKERSHIDTAFNEIDFPFTALEAPTCNIDVQWSYEHLIGYLNTWSSVQKYIQQHQTNPVESLAAKLKAHWPEGAIKQVRFPIFVKAGLIKK